MPVTNSVIAILVLAAGASRRMRGRDKLLEMIDGKAQLARVVDTAGATGAPVFVTLPAGAPDRAAVVSGGDPEIIEVADAASGMAASLRAWAKLQRIGGAREYDGVLIMLADMPDITGADLSALISAFRAAGSIRVVRASDADGNPGHPVVFPRRVFDQFHSLTGDQGARSLLSGEDTVFVALPDHHATTDLDTPEDWDNWRNSR